MIDQQSGQIVILIRKGLQFSLIRYLKEMH